MEKITLTLKYDCADLAAACRNHGGNCVPGIHAICPVSFFSCPIQNEKSCKDITVLDWENSIQTIDTTEGTQFKPFDKVLVRPDKESQWMPDLYAIFREKDDYHHKMIDGYGYKHCIPYEGNEDKCGKVTKE